MALKVMSKKKANSASKGIFLISLGILIATNEWWPGIILAIWATLASRQYLSGRYYYAILSSVVLLGLFIVSYFKFNSENFAPVLLVTAGIFIVFREYYFGRDTNGTDKTEEILEDADIDERK